MYAPKFPRRFSVLISEEGKRIPAPLKTLSWSCRHVNRYDVNAMKRKRQTNNEKVPAILWVRSSLTNSFTDTFTSFSGFSCSGFGFGFLADFRRFAMDAKISW